MSAGRNAACPDAIMSAVTLKINLTGVSISVPVLRFKILFFFNCEASFIVCCVVWNVQSVKQTLSITTHTWLKEKITLWVLRSQKKTLLTGKTFQKEEQIKWSSMGSKAPKSKKPNNTEHEAHRETKTRQLYNFAVTHHHILLCPPLTDRSTWTVWFGTFGPSDPPS